MRVAAVEHPVFATDDRAWATATTTMFASGATTYMTAYRNRQEEAREQLGKQLDAAVAKAKSETEAEDSVPPPTAKND